jgi:hypothetical protein
MTVYRGAWAAPTGLRLKPVSSRKPCEGLANRPLQPTSGALAVGPIDALVHAARG